MPENKRTKIFFASDFHLGVDLNMTSKDRERIIVQWLDAISLEAKAVYLVGDVFDLWFEYKSVVPKGYIRLLATLAKMVEEGIEIHFSKGNHDMWVFDYFQNEIGINVHDGPITPTIDGKNFLITHGDGLGKGDTAYKLIKGILRNPIAQKLFSLIHPTLGLKLMSISSNTSRKKGQAEPAIHQSRIIQHAEECSKVQSLDYFICGHFHYPQILTLSNDQTKYCNLGDWISHFSYAVWDGQELQLKEFERN